MENLETVSSTIDNSLNETLSDRLSSRKAKKDELLDEKSESKEEKSSGSKLVNTISNNLNVKEMPVNPFDFIWDANDLMPKLENDRVLLNAETDLRLSRNKSNLGARVSPSERVHTLSVNELTNPHEEIKTKAKENQNNEQTKPTTTKKQIKKRSLKRKKRKARPKSTVLRLQSRQTTMLC